MTNGTAQRTKILVALAVAVVTVLVFLPVLGNGFVNWDDDALVYRNPFIRSLRVESLLLIFAYPHFHSYTPLTLVSHAVDVAIWGMTPLGHHLTSLTLHALNAVLLFFVALGILERTSKRPQSCQDEYARLAGAAVAALAFALHPMRVESAAWVADRKDLLSCFFGLGTLLWYIAYLRVRGSASGMRWYLLALCTFFLALLSKSSVLTLPLALCVLDIVWYSWQEARVGWKGLVTEKIPFLLLSAVAGFIALRSAPSNAVNYAISGMSGFERVLLPIYGIVFPLAKLVWPFSLGPVYDSPGTSMLVLAVLAFVTVTLGAIWIARRTTAPLLVWLGYVLLLIPVIAGTTSGIQPWGDRYVYVPSVPLFLLLGGWVLSLDRHVAASHRRTFARSVLAIVAGSVLIGWGTLSHFQIPFWRNSETLWTHAATVAPRSPIPPNNLGIDYYERKEYARAIASYDRAVVLEPRYAEGHYNAGLAFEAEGKYGEAIARYTRAIEVNPGYVDAYINKGSLLLAAGNTSGAIESYERALLIDPGSADAHYHKGIVLMKAGKGDEAMESFREAVRRNPYLVPAWNNIGVLCFSSRDYAGAREAWSRVTAIQPDDPDAFYNLGVLASAEGDTAAAIGAYSRALERKSDYVSAEMNLGVLEVSSGRYDDGIRHYRHAISIDSALAPLYYNLGVAYYNKGDLEAARAQFSRGLAIDTSNPTIAYTLGVVCADLGRRDEARAAMMRAARLGSVEAQAFLAQEGKK